MKDSESFHPAYPTLYYFCLCHTTGNPRQCWLSTVFVTSVFISVAPIWRGARPTHKHKYTVIKFNNPHKRGRLLDLYLLIDSLIGIIIHHLLPQSAILSLRLSYT